MSADVDVDVTICTTLYTVAEDKHGKPWFWLGTVPPPGYEPPEVKSLGVVTEVDREKRTITISDAAPPRKTEPKRRAKRAK